MSNGQQHWDEEPVGAPNTSIGALLGVIVLIGILALIFWRW